MGRGELSTTSGGTTTSYTYDGDDRRLSATTSGGGPHLRYGWDTLAESGMPELALERTATGALVRRYLDGPARAVAYTTGAGTFSYHHDPLGDISDVTDATGTAQWRYHYEPYGAERSVTNVSGSAPENRLRFTAQYLDTETTEYHLRARQYDPATGRFDGLDPVELRVGGPSSSSYAYAVGAPTTLIDPLGEAVIGIGDNAVGAIFGAATLMWAAQQCMMDPSCSGWGVRAWNIAHGWLATSVPSDGDEAMKVSDIIPKLKGDYANEIPGEVKEAESDS